MYWVSCGFKVEVSAGLGWKEVVCPKWPLICHGGRKWTIHPLLLPPVFLLPEIFLLLERMGGKAALLEELGIAY